MNVEFEETLKTGNPGEAIQIVLITDGEKLDSASIEIGDYEGDDTATFEERHTYGIEAAERLYIALGEAIEIAKREVNAWFDEA